MFLSYCLSIALFICVTGSLWRMGRWCFIVLGPEAATLRPQQRMAAMVRAIGRTLLSAKLWPIIRSIILDVLVQRQIARRSIPRWIMHMGLFYGTVLLILMHALDEHIMTRVVSEYASTLNPFMFLRNLMGLFMCMGLLIAIIRRQKIEVLKRFNTFADRLTIVLLSSILFSGIALEAVQVTSSALFDEMVVDYWGSEDEDEIAPLKAYWANQFDVVFKTEPSMDRSLLEEGRQTHEDFCAACHSRPLSAFMAYPLAMALKPVATHMSGLRLDIVLWYIHFLSCCLALAYLPFGKLFHLISVPLSLAIASTGDAAGNRPENRPTRRALGLDACTHCGVCSQHCSVATIMTVIDNPTILPSEKIGSVNQMSLEDMSPKDQWRLAQGSHICTACGRCSDRCPSAIDLHDLWLASETDLIHHGFQQPHGWIRDQNMVQWADQANEKRESDTADTTSNKSVGPRFTENPDTFWACVQCTTCTNVCPVVAASDDPRRDLDMTPQQIMNLMRLELKDNALGCRMVWDCVTCYKCQEHCPQGVPVADVLYELRNEACQRLSPSGPKTMKYASNSQKPNERALK